MNIFIGENDSKDEVLDELTQKLDIQKFKNEFSDVFKKANNNWVGYYLFQDGDEYYKIFVLPKTITKPKDNTKVEEVKVIEKFIEYIKVHYKLRAKYDNYEPNGLNLKSSLELIFDSNTGKDSAQEIEQVIFCKYEVIFKEILNFFNTHKSYKRVKKPYISQTIKYNLNLLNNIKEPNKTKIHQDKMEEIIYSEMATITIGVLKLFTNSKLSLIQNEQLRINLHHLLFKIRNMLQKKYGVDKSFDLTINKLISSKTYKFFKRKRKAQNLYINLLSLFGIENFYEEEENKQLNQSIKAESFFIRPEEFYEWFIYDKLISQYGNEYEILKHKLHKKIVKEYKINDTKKNSNPDITMRKLKDNSLYIIDAKWKLLNKDNIPDMNDVLKLKRDTEIRSNDAKEIFSLLIYPKVNENIYTEYLISNEKPTFKFYSRQICVTDDKIDIFNNLKDISLDNIYFTKFNQAIKQINKSDYNNSPEYVEQVTDEISSYIKNHFTEDTIFKNYPSVRSFIDNELDKSDSMIRLLKSSVAVLYYLDNFVEKEYADYTLPASSIWKAIENEIKENIKYLICNIKNNRGSKLYNNIITLGTYKFVFKNIVNYKERTCIKGSTYIVFKDILEQLEEEVESYKTFFEIITDMRNEYTHCELMTKTKFHEEIIKGIFTKDICSTVMIDDIIKLNNAITRFKEKK